MRQPDEMTTVLRAINGIEPITVWVIAMRRGGKPCAPETFRDIVGGRVYATAEEAMADIQNTGLTHNDVSVWLMDLDMPTR